MKKMLGRMGAVIISTVFVACAREPANAPKPVPIVSPAPGATGLPAVGRPAITPFANATITAAQVRSYVLSHRVPFALRATNVTIRSISFVNGAQVRAALRSARLGVSDREPLCLVVMSGTFVFTGPPGRPPAFPIGIEVFDARTGHLLQSGGLPRAPRIPATAGR
jgi:hypothetical protein